MRSILFIGIVAVGCSGCRVVHNETYTTNNGNKNEVENTSDGKQEAGKDFGSAFSGNDATVTD